MSGSTIVVGAGMAGLVAARCRLARGEEVLLLEASDRPGGVVRSVRRDGFLLEAGPNTVRPAPELWGLVRELGLQADALLSDPRAPRYVDFLGVLHPLPMSPPALLATRLLSAHGKLRLAAEPFRRRGRGGAETVRSFFARRLGPEVAERFVEPFVSGIFAGDGSSLSIGAAFPTLARWEHEHGSLLAGAIASRTARRGAAEIPRGLLSFPDGLETLPRALAASLGECLRLSSPVESLEPSRSGWVVRARGERIAADRVILATPAPVSAALVRPLAREAAAALEQIPYPPLLVLHLAFPVAALRRRLEGFGHLVVPSPHRRILGAVWSSSLFPGRAPEGQALLTAFLGGARDPEAAGLASEELVSTATGDLEAEGIVAGPARLIMLTRWPRAIPQYDLGHEARIAALERAEHALPGLSFLGNYRGGISVADVVRNAMTT